jgi:hypothetical protein
VTFWSCERRSDVERVSFTGHLPLVELLRKKRVWICGGASRNAVVEAVSARMRLWGELWRTVDKCARRYGRESGLLQQVA